MNKKILIPILTIFVIGGILVYANKNPKVTDDVIHIGALIPLSGTGATLGEWMKKGVLHAQETINAQGGINDKRLEIHIEDDVCDGKTAVSAYRKLHDTQDIKYFVGPLCAAARIPVLSAAEKDESLIITTGLAVTYGQKQADKTFNVLPSVTFITDHIVSFAFDKLGSKKISLLTVNDEFGKEAEAAFISISKKYGIDNPYIEKFTKGTSDMRAQLTKIAQDDSDTVLVVGFTPEYAVFMKQATELGLKKKFIALSPIQAPDVAKANKGTGIVFYYPHPVATASPSAQAFLKEYQAKDAAASEMSPVYLGSGYDAVMLTALAIEKCADDITCAENTLQALTNYPGANGYITFGEKGNINSADSMEVRILQNGKFSKFK